MDGTGQKETTRVAAPVASNTLSVNVFTAPTSEQELFDQMTELYPHWVANQSWLMFGFPGV
jgi:hypothetical protein